MIPIRSYYDGRIIGYLASEYNSNETTENNNRAMANQPTGNV